MNRHPLIDDCYRGPDIGIFASLRHVIFRPFSNWYRVFSFLFCHLCVWTTHSLRSLKTRRALSLLFLFPFCWPQRNRLRTVIISYVLHRLTFKWKEAHFIWEPFHRAEEDKKEKTHPYRKVLGQCLISVQSRGLSFTFGSLLAISSFGFFNFKPYPS